MPHSQGSPVIPILSRTTPISCTNIYFWRPVIILFFSNLATCPVHLNLLDLSILAILGERNKLLLSSYRWRMPEGPLLKMPYTDGGETLGKHPNINPWSSSPVSQNIIHNPGHESLNQFIYGGVMSGRRYWRFILGLLQVNKINL